MRCRKSSIPITTCVATVFTAPAFVCCQHGGGISGHTAAITEYDEPAPRQRRQRRRDPPGPVRRYIHGAHAAGRPGHGHAQRRHRSGDPVLLADSRDVVRRHRRPAEPSHGLKGICGFNDMREIYQQSEQGNAAAQRAITMYCYRIRKYIGAYTAVLGRVDAIVFTAGIGENAAFIREQVCASWAVWGSSWTRRRTWLHARACWMSPRPNQPSGFWWSRPMKNGKSRCRPGACCKVRSYFTIDMGMQQ